MHGAASFTQSTTPMTPGAAAVGDGQSPEANPVGSVISQGGEQPDPNQQFDGAHSDGGDGEGGLDFNDDPPLEDGQLAENDELAGLNGELGNLENDFPSDDVGGDIMNPMEDAEYYQGSFQEDDPHFAEYRSQGSDDEDNIEQL